MGIVETWPWVDRHSGEPSGHQGPDGQLGVGCQPILVLNAPAPRRVPAELVWLFLHPPQGLPSSLRSQRPR